MDCLEGLKLLDDNSVDSIVTDPPYELGFMGKKWDSTGIAYNVDLWKECLRVLKPGGHLLAFGGTRTYHRMVCAIEDAGFEIRDCLQWLYGSGFPKSMDISKAIDKAVGVERDVIGVKPYTSQDIRGNAYKSEKAKQRPRLECPITAPATPEVKQWEGWGTALKPAHEPIVLARKPISEKTIAENVLKWGTGGLNIDECRIPVNWKEEYPPSWFTSGKSKENAKDYWGKGNIKKNTVADRISDKGRFPANVILDEEAGKLLDEQSGILKSAKVKSAKPAYEGESITKFLRGRSTPNNQYDDCDGASRFFYCAKASKKERGEGNNHPTVKPLSLIKYLITLVTPPEGVCLDPFEGSGTHALACEELGFNYIGFELNKEYYEVAKNRINKHIIDNNLQGKYSLIT